MTEPDWAQASEWARAREWVRVRARVLARALWLEALVTVPVDSAAAWPTAP